MTTAVPARRAATQMTHTTDPDPMPQPPAIESAVAAQPARTRLRGHIAENPLLSLFGGLMVALLTIFGTVVVALLLFTLNSISDRIDGVEMGLGERIDGVEMGLEMRLGERIDRLEMRLSNRMDRLEDRLAVQDAAIAEGNRKLTALIAALNAREAIDSALEGRLLAPAVG